MVRPVWIQPTNILVTVIIICLVGAFFLVDDYGVNWDTLGVMEYGRLSLNAYSLRMISNPQLVEDMIRRLYEPYSDLYISNLRFYGPVFHTFSQYLYKILNNISSIDPINFNGFVIFVSYLIGMLCLYYLCCRYFNEWFALVVAIAFFSQPLLFGHSFINSKDIPFTSFFIASIAVGFKMVDQVFKNKIALMEGDERVERGKFIKYLINDYLSLENKERKKIGFVAAGWIGFVATIILLIPAIDDIVAYFVRVLYEAHPISFFGQIFSIFSSQRASIPVELFVAKGQILFHRILAFWFLIISSIMLFKFIRLLPNLFGFLSQELGKLIREMARLPRNICSSLINKHIIFAGVVLGLTLSNRNLGFAAGGIVGILLLIRCREKSIGAVISYVVIAAGTTIASWPYLWHDPWGRFVRSIKFMSQHPWEGRILYGGESHWSYNMPVSYLPKLIAIQFTIPIIILSLIGFGVYLFRRKKNSREIELLLISLWFLLPLTYVIIARPTLYQNFRQFLFITPPLFIFAGVGLSRMGEMIKNHWMALLSALVILPGLVSTINLHPYQYIYYNYFVGGVEGAHRYYETDYWCASFRDAMTYLNEHSEQGSKILIWGSPGVARYYAREDLIVTNKGDVDSLENYDYALLTTSNNADLKNVRAGEIVYAVEVRNVILSVVKKLK